MIAVEHRSGSRRRSVTSPESALRSRFHVWRLRRGARKVRCRSLFSGPMRATIGIVRVGAQVGPFCSENVRSRPRDRQAEKPRGGAEIPVGSRSGAPRLWPTPRRREALPDCGVDFLAKWPDVRRTVANFRTALKARSGRYVLHRIETAVGLRATRQATQVRGNRLNLRVRHIAR
jgi:hypothetical protein